MLSFLLGIGSKNELFFRFFFVPGCWREDSKLRKPSKIGYSKWEKSPSSCTVSPYLYERLKFSSSFFAIMIILLVIITCSFYGGFLLLCCHVPGISHLTYDFELIGDVTVVETSCMSSSELRLLFTLLNHLVCLLSVLISRWETFARSRGRSLLGSQITCHLLFRRLSRSSSQDLVIFITHEVTPY